MFRLEPGLITQLGSLGTALVMLRREYNQQQNDHREGEQQTVQNRNAAIEFLDQIDRRTLTILGHVEMLWGAVFSHEESD